MVGSQSQYFMNALQRSKHWTPFSSAAVFATIAYCRAWLTSRVSESESCSLIGAGVTTILLEQHISPTFPPGPLKPKSRFVGMSLGSSYMKRLLPIKFRCPLRLPAPVGGYGQWLGSWKLPEAKTRGFSPSGFRNSYVHSKWRLYLAP